MSAGRPVIQGLWVGGDLSVMERLSISSFVAHGHSFHLYAYDDIANIPRGAILKDAAEIVSRALLFNDETLNAPVSFSDVFRYKLLLDVGGYWSDLDVVCLKPFSFDSEYVFASEKTKEDSDERRKYGLLCVNGCVMKAPRNSSIMRSCYEMSLQQEVPLYGWELGPPILNRAIRDHGLQEYVHSDTTFAPVTWWDWKDFVSGEIPTRLKYWHLWKSHAVHLWDSMWIREDTDKEAPYDRKCLYERLKARYLDTEP